MSISRAQLEAVSEALAAVLPLTAPADVSLRGFFRERPDLGLRDRGLVAETVYAVLRRKRLLDRLAPGASMHRLALAALTTLQGYSVRDLEPAGEGAEKLLKLLTCLLHGRSALDQTIRAAKCARGH